MTKATVTTGLTIEGQIFLFGEELVKASKGRLRIAHQEQSDEAEPNEFTNHFLKLDERRLGSDLEVYIALAKEPAGLMDALYNIAQDIFFPLDQVFPKQLQSASKILFSLGVTTFDDEMLKEWEQLIPKDEHEEALYKFLKTAVEHSGFRLRLAFQEKDCTNEHDPLAGHFLKRDGARIGRDLEEYARRGNEELTWEEVLPLIVKEIFFQLPPNATQDAGKILYEFGASIYADSPFRMKIWDKLFLVEEEAQST